MGSWGISAMSEREPYLFEDWIAGSRPPKGWDCADAVDDGWSRAQLDAFLRATVRPWSPDPAGKIVDSPEPTHADPEPRQPPREPVAELRPIAQPVPADEDPPKVVDMRTRLRVVAELDWRSKLKLNEENKTKPTVQMNWALWLENHEDTAGLFAFNAFKRSVILRREPPWFRGGEWTDRPIRDTDLAEAAMWLEDLWMSPNPSKLSPIIAAIAERNSFDPLTEYLEGLVWDGKSRVDGWLTYYLGADQSEFTRAVGKKFLISAVARALSPGCKVDTMIVLEGDQGLLKSSALRALFSTEFFTDEISDVNLKDASQEMQGVWCVEISEMSRFTSAEAGAVKKFLSRQIDRYRPPYGKSVIDAPRRAVIAGTINPDGNPYLRDPTGARRFWPVVVTAIDLDGIAADRNQLWAEAVHLYRSGERWWFGRDEEALARGEQASRTVADPWCDVISGMVLGRSSISMREILEALEIKSRDLDQRHTTRVGRAMAAIGWEMKRDGEKTTFAKPGAKVTLADDPSGW